MMKTSIEHRRDVLVPESGGAERIVAKWSQELLDCEPIRLRLTSANRWASLGGCGGGPKKRLYETYFRQFGSAGQWDGPYTCVLIVLSIRHRGLRSLLEDDNSRFLPPNLVDLVRKILTVLILAEDLDGFIGNASPGGRVHRLSGNRRNEWSVSVSGHWRITF